MIIGDRGRNLSGDTSVRGGRLCKAAVIELTVGVGVRLLGGVRVRLPVVSFTNLSMSAWSFSTDSVMAWDTGVLDRVIRGEPKLLCGLFCTDPCFTVLTGDLVSGLFEVHTVVDVMCIPGKLGCLGVRCRRSLAFWAPVVGAFFRRRLLRSVLTVFGRESLGTKSARVQLPSGGRRGGGSGDDDLSAVGTPCLLVTVLRKRGGF